MSNAPSEHINMEVVVSIGLFQFKGDGNYLEAVGKLNSK